MRGWIIPITLGLCIVVAAILHFMAARISRGGRDGAQKLPAENSSPDATKLSDRIKELEQEKATLEANAETDVKIIEENKATIEKLQEELRHEKVKAIYHENESRLLKLRYEWLHEMADKHAKEISERLQVQNYFAVYQRSADSLPRIYLGWDVYNKSVFDIVIESEIAGYIRLDGNVNLRKPERMFPVAISPLESGLLVIEQHLSPEQFDLIIKRENDKEGAFFYFNKLQIEVKITSPFHEDKSAPLELPHRLSSRDVKNRAAIEFQELQRHASNIEKLTLALGSCYLAYKQIRRDQLLPEADYQTLKDDIGFSLDSCFGKEAGTEFFSQQPPFPSTLEEQDKWVDLQCKNLRELIEKEKK